MFYKFIKVIFSILYLLVYIITTVVLWAILSTINDKIVKKEYVYIIDNMIMILCIVFLVRSIIGLKRIIKKG